MDYRNCELCPRRCGVDRGAGERGWCGAPDVALVAKPMLPQWEEMPDNSVGFARKELYIDDLCVDEAARGKGVATALFRFVTDTAKAAGADFITLNVWHGNSALDFYEKMGMKPRKVFMDLPLED